MWILIAAAIYAALPDKTLTTNDRLQIFVFGVGMLWIVSINLP